MKREPRNNYENELRRAELRARSFDELRAPLDAMLIGIVHKNDDRYYYYKMPDGTYLFETASGRLFKEQMKNKKRTD